MAKESGDDRYQYESTGVKDAVERLRLDKGTYKGELHFKATFIPALALKGVKFDTSKHQDQSTERDKAGSVTSSSSSSAVSVEETAPAEVTIKRRSTASIGSKNGEPKRDGVEDTVIRKTSQVNDIREGVEMSTEELLAQRWSHIRGFTHRVLIQPSQSPGSSSSTSLMEYSQRKHDWRSRLTMVIGPVLVPSSRGAHTQYGSMSVKVS